MSFKDEKIVKVEKEEEQEDEYWFEKIKEVEIEREREMDKKIEELSGGKEWKDRGGVLELFFSTTYHN